MIHSSLFFLLIDFLLMLRKYIKEENLNRNIVELS